MITKLSLAFAVAFSFIILGAFGFDADNPSSTSLLILTLFYGFVPVCLKILAVFFINKYTDTKA
jgi:Na+/melibiose symporter-like transporter